jgi:hypothetical protein
MDNFSSIGINLFSSLIFFLVGLLVARLWQWWIWRKRLAQIEQTARNDEIAICVRVGGNSNPVPDVIKFLRQNHPAIKKLLVYNVETGNLDETKTAQRIVEDVLEGLRTYGKGEITRIHYFSSGMVAYTPILPSIVSNWGTFVVYHKRSDCYVPLYEISKEVKNEFKRDLKPFQTWEVISTEEKS